MKILFVMTAANQLTLKNGEKHPTGFWAEEFLAPYEQFTRAGYEVEVATPGGAQPPVDQVSLDPASVGGADHARQLKQELEQAGPLRSPRDLKDVQASDYAAVFIPGGHGPMEDLAHSPQVARLLGQAHQSGLLTAAVCHGPAALLAARDDQDGWSYAGYRMTAFSNREEDMTPLAGKVPFALESELTNRGAVYSQADAWSPYVVEDRELITGENPASSGLIAEHVLRRLAS